MRAISSAVTRRLGAGYERSMGKVLCRGPSIGSADHRAQPISSRPSSVARMAQNGCSSSFWMSEALERQGFPGLKLPVPQLLPLALSFRYGASHADSHLLRNDFRGFGLLGTGLGRPAGRVVVWLIERPRWFKRIFLMANDMAMLSNALWAAY